MDLSLIKKKRMSNVIVTAEIQYGGKIAWRLFQSDACVMDFVIFCREIDNLP